MDSLGQSLGFENMNTLSGVQYTLENRVMKIKNSVKSIYKYFENSIERCHTFTGNVLNVLILYKELIIKGHSELNALIHVIDGCLDVYHTLLVNCIKDLSVNLLPLKESDDDGDETKNVMDPVISLLRIIADLEKRMKHLKQLMTLAINELDDMFKNLNSSTDLKNKLFIK